MTKKRIRKMTTQNIAFLISVCKDHQKDYDLASKILTRETVRLITMALWRLSLHQNQTKTEMIKEIEEIMYKLPQTS